MKTINIELSQQSIKKAIAEIEAYKNSLAFKMSLFLERLAGEGIPVIDENINTEGDSSPEHYAYVRMRSFGDWAEATLVLEGRDILFIEFGAGVHYNGAVGSSAYPRGTELGFTIGSYGKGQGANDYWFYTAETGESVRSQGTKASMPMFKAGEKIKERVKDIAKEVFGSS